jgi:hypothetical protein
VTRYPGERVANCTPYPPLTATGLSKTTGDEVTATNHSVAGYTTKDAAVHLNQSRLRQQDPAVHRSVTLVNIALSADEVYCNRRDESCVRIESRDDVGR